MAHTIALVDDDRNILTSVSIALEAEGFTVRTFTDGAEALRGLTAQPVDLAVLDIKMPRMDGMELLSRLRKTTAMPVIFLTSKDDEVDEVLGLRMGADDYIKKPFSQRLLIERIRALLRRGEIARETPDGEGEPAIHRGPLVLDPGRHACTWKGLEVTLTVTEFLLLKALAVRPGHVKNRDQLMDAAYGESIYVDDRTIDSHIKRLRKKFKVVDEEFQQIETLYGVGYRYREGCDGEPPSLPVPMRPFVDSERLEPELRDADGPPPPSRRVPAASAMDRVRPARGWRYPFGSALTRRILAVNVLPLLILVGGLLYVGEYRRGLVQSELDALRTQAELIANALGEGTVDRAGPAEDVTLSLEAARHMVRRLVEPTGARARLFAADGSLVADTRLLSGPGGSIYIERLPPPENDPPLLGVAGRVYGWVVGLLPDGEELPLFYHERPSQSATDYVEVLRALEGEPMRMRRRDALDRTVLSAAVPVQRFKQVLGAVMLSTEDQAIQKAIRSVRFDILRVFAVALASTVLLSLYLGGTIVRPVLRLARAAERVKRGHGRQPEIPQIGRRNDEIGDLAELLRTMTQVLWQRLNANERFAADVAHEIKNPLTSRRSAVETAARVKDPDQQRRLMAIIQEDVGRLDRLITDISDASRLDAELSRDATETVDVARLLDALAELHQTTEDGAGPAIRLDIARHQDLSVTGLESRLGQVFRNLIANAVSFSPPDGTVTLRAARQGAWVVAQVEDEGPGIPPDKLEAIFERFYSERPSGEKFGTHSGLGLSISKQIVEAHGGSIAAENRPAPGGARFTVRLPSDRR